MEKVDISELLGSYAPLVQLMAGVYLLFYYSTMFKKKRPFDSMEKRMLKNFSEIIKSGNLYIEPNQIEKDRKLFLKLWREYKMSVEAVARIGCLYTITVLVYCGYEGVSGKIGLMALWIDSIICALYTVFVIFFIRKKELCKWWIWVGYMIIMIFIGFCCPPKNIDPSSFELFGIRCKYITHFVCLMSLFPALASIIQYIIDECHYAHINLCIVYSNRMSKKLSNLHMQIGAETEMQIFREKYGCVIGIDSWWEYENEEFSITIEDWERRVGEFYRRRYSEYWLLPISRKIVYQMDNLPNKISKWIKDCYYLPRKYMRLKNQYDSPFIFLWVIIAFGILLTCLIFCK